MELAPGPLSIRKVTKSIDSQFFELKVTFPVVLTIRIFLGSSFGTG